MRTELRLVAHTQLPGAKVVEIWYGGTFIGQVVGAEGAGVRVISKHNLEVEHLVGHGVTMDPDVVTVTVRRAGGS